MADGGRGDRFTNQRDRLHDRCAQQVLDVVADQPRLGAHLPDPHVDDGVGVHRQRLLGPAALFPQPVHVVEDRAVPGRVGQTRVDLGAGTGHPQGVRQQQTVELVAAHGVQMQRTADRGRIGTGGQDRDGEPPGAEIADDDRAVAEGALGVFGCGQGRP